MPTGRFDLLRAFHYALRAVPGTYVVISCLTRAWTDRADVAALIPDKALNLAYESVAASNPQNRANIVSGERRMRRMTRVAPFSIPFSAVGWITGARHCDRPGNREGSPRPIPPPN